VQSIYLLILLLATFTRFYRLGYQSLWSDEGNSILLARAGFSEIARRTAFDIHPPLYYWLLKLWTLFWGESEFAVRALSAGLGILLVGLVYRLGARLFSQRVGLASAFVAALAPFQIYYAQETRMYMLLVLLAAACVGVTIEAWRSTGGRLSRSLVGYVLLVTLGLYTHYAFPLILVITNGMALLAWWRLMARQTRLWAWIGLQLIPFILYLPWLPIALRQITTWPALVEAATAGEVGLTLARYISLGPSATAISTGWLIVFGGLALLGLAAGLWRWRRQPRYLFNLGSVLLWFLLPAGLTAVLFRPAYLKMFLMASPAFCLLIGLGIVSWAWPGPPLRFSGQTMMPYMAAFLVATPSLLALNAYYHDPQFHRDNYRGIAAFIEAVAGPDDAVILHAPGQQEVFSYYYQPGPGQAAIYPLPRQRPLDAQATFAELEALTGQANRIYGIYWATEEADPSGLIETWLNQHTFKASDIWFGNVRLVSYAAPKAEMVLNQTDFLLGEDIHLVSFGLSHTQITPGEILQIRLIWRTDQPLVEDYTVFAQLLDEANHLVGQRDAPPLIPTSTWEPGELIADHHGLYLEPGTPPRPVRLIVGLYDAATQVRLSTTEDGDFVELKSILVAHNASPLPGEAYQIQHRLNSPFLLGYDLHPLGRISAPEMRFRASEPLHLNLYWRRPAGLPPDDRIEIRLVNAQGVLTTSWQRRAAGIDYPMLEWQRGEIVRGQFDLFLNEIPPGQYQLEIGQGRKIVGKTKVFDVVE